MLVNEEDLILHKIEANGCSFSYKFSIGEKVIFKGEVCEIRGILIVKDVLGNVEFRFVKWEQLDRIEIVKHDFIPV